MVIRMQHKLCPLFPLTADLDTGTAGVYKGEDR